jgi:hypothetical protein
MNLDPAPAMIAELILNWYYGCTYICIKRLFMGIEKSKGEMIKDQRTEIPAQSFNNVKRRPPQETLNAASRKRLG